MSDDRPDPYASGRLVPAVLVEWHPVFGYVIEPERATGARFANVPAAPAPKAVADDRA